MNLQDSLSMAGWIAIGLEIVLFLIWVYNVFGPGNGTDPAGRGMAQLFLIGLVTYILAGILLLRLESLWTSISVLVMSAIPLTLVIVGLVKYYGSRNT
ncbi:MAG: hypothetical protein H7Y31_13205 [Chitinophagaceae bacterium]|nr:hypothetical protein [Chitinophagaceae bacterium]